jgi:hypothetical protein
MRNVGSPDRIIRVVAGLALIVLPFLLSATVFANPFLFWGSLGAGAILIVTAATGFCPIYAALGLRTRPRTLTDSRG